MGARERWVAWEEVEDNGPVANAIRQFIVNKPGALMSGEAEALRNAPSRVELRQVNPRQLSPMPTET